MDLSRWYVINWCNPCTLGLGTALSIGQSLSVFPRKRWVIRMTQVSTILPVAVTLIGASRMTQRGSDGAHTQHL